MGDRHAFRAKWHDYSNDGIYFVTICADQRQHLFGEIADGAMLLSPIGQVVNDCLKALPDHIPSADVINYVIMPNHVHLVVGAQYIAPAANAATLPAAPAVNRGCLRPPRHGEECADYHFNSALAVIIGSFKSACTKLVRRKMSEMAAQTDATLMRTRHAASLPADNRPFRVWQRGFHEHIIRDQRAYDNIMNYVDNNVANWHKDCFNELKRQ